MQTLYYRNPKSIEPHFISGLQSNNPGAGGEIHSRQDLQILLPIVLCDQLYQGGGVLGVFEIDDTAEGVDAEPESSINHLLGSSITYRIAVGPQQGRKVFTLQTLPDCRSPWYPHAESI